MSATLFYTSGSCSLAAHWCLAEADAVYDLVAVSLAEGEQTQPAYRAINPKGLIPALRVSEGIITEVPAILTYIAARYPEAKLLPSTNPFEIAKSHEKMCWLTSTAHVVIAQIFRSARFSDDSAIQEGVKAHGLERIKTIFQQIETWIPGGNYVLGDNFSALDPYIFVFNNWGLRLGFDMSQYKAWHTHSLRMIERKAAKTVFDREEWQPLIKKDLERQSA